MNRYSLRTDSNGTRIALPNNGGELGDKNDTVRELNKLLTDSELARSERDEIIESIRNLKEVQGRHNTQIAMVRLFAHLSP